MNFEDTHQFEKPASTVIKMFTDRRYFERKYQALGATSLEVLECNADDKHFRIKCRFTMRSDAPIPAALKKFVGDSSVVTQQDTWDADKRTGRLDVEIRGLPVKISAEMVLCDEDGGSANHLQWNIRCGIPLVGGKIEKLIAEDIRAKSARDVAQSGKLLQDY